MAITVPYTFVNATTAEASEVNANFSAIIAKALDKTGDTMTGTLTIGTIAISTSLDVSATTTVKLATSQATNDLFFASSASKVGRVAGAASSVLITSSGSVPSLSQTLPTAVQDNITRLGTVTSGVWNAGTVTATSLVGTLTGGCTGNAGTATRLETPRAINGVNFDGTADITVTAETIASGVVWMFAGTSAPTGWLLCDGSAISRTTYSGLFAVIGETYGVGDGVTTFNVPDYRDRMPIGKSATLALGATGGSFDHTHTGPSHTHAAGTLAGPLHSHTGPAHTHDYGTLAVAAHTHSVADHTHLAGTLAGPGHTHTGPSHTHDAGTLSGPSHWHVVDSHTHTGPSHSHAAGTLAGPLHAHTVAAHTHTGPSHTHTFSDLSTSQNGDHTHTFSVTSSGPSTLYSAAGTVGNAVTLDHTHSVSGTTSGATGNHEHTVSGTTGASGTAATGSASPATDSQGTGSVTGSTGLEGTGATGAASPNTSSAGTGTVGGLTGASGTGNTSSDGTGAVTGSTALGGAQTSSAASSTSVSGATASAGTGATGSEGTGSVTGATAADGTGATGTGNPPYLGINFIIKT